jgi:FixJ family two-component response regulator
MQTAEAKKLQKVLIVDDDAPVRRVLARHMKMLGHTTIEAGDGAQGLLAVRLSKPDVILLDLRMPKMDGHAFLKQLVAEKNDTAVIVLSGHAEVRDRVEVMLAGAVQFLQKPWSQEELIKAMERAQERSARRSG